MSHPYDMGDKKNMSVLGPTLKFKGELSASEDLLIQGEVEGSINHTSNLTIGPEGKVRANVRAEHISVEGKVEGDLVGTSSVVVKESSEVDGNIYSPTVTLREGSRFNGKIDMSGQGMPQAETRDEADDPVPEDQPEASATNHEENDSGEQEKQAAGAA